MSLNELLRNMSMEDDDDLDELFRQNFPGFISHFELLLRLFSGSLSLSKKKLNFLLLGKTGHGKSATGNMALGRKEFESRTSATSVTSEVKRGQVEYENYLVNIIDTPGLADTNFGTNKFKEIEKVIIDMEKAIAMCQEGIHAFLFVVKFGNRFTKEEESTLHSFRQIFGHSFLANHGIILFTHGDTFEQAMEDEDTPKKNFRTWCREQKGSLGDLMKECSYRCVLFNNRQKNEQEKQTQIGSLIRLAESFEYTYGYLDYMLCDDSRQKLIVELKAPQRTDEFQKKIRSLRLEIERTCGTGSTTEYDFVRLEVSVAALSDDIQEEDKNTGVLNNLIEEVACVMNNVNQYKWRQAEARRLQAESESNCSII